MCWRQEIPAVHNRCRLGSDMKSRGSDVGTYPPVSRGTKFVSCRRYLNRALVDAGPANHDPQRIPGGLESVARACEAVLLYRVSRLHRSGETMKRHWTPALRMPSRKCGMARAVYGTYCLIHSIETLGCSSRSRAKAASASSVRPARASAATRMR